MRNIYAGTSSIQSLHSTITGAANHDFKQNNSASLYVTIFYNYATYGYFEMWVVTFPNP